jgi:hypothetical protein
VWPNANHYAKTLIKEVIEPNVRTSLEAYKLNGFRFERMILGSIVSILMHSSKQIKPDFLVSANTA